MLRRHSARHSLNSRADAPAQPDVADVDAATGRRCDQSSVRPVRKAAESIAPASRKIASTGCGLAIGHARSDDVPHRWQHQAPRLPERVRISACPVSALCLRMISSSRSSAAVVGSFRELLDHIVVFNDRLLFGLLRDYVAYHHHDRTHLGLDKATPASRPRQTRPVGDAQVIALSRLGDLHHRYEWRAAGRSAPRPPSLRVRHACIDFARHVHRLHLSRIRPSGRRLHNPLEHVRRPRLPPDSAPIQTSWSGAGVPLRGADAVVAKDKTN